MNYYDEEWLKHLHPEGKKELNVRPARPLPELEVEGEVMSVGVE